MFQLVTSELEGKVFFLTILGRRFTIPIFFVNKKISGLTIGSEFGNIKRLQGGEKGLAII
jgi:hypothetical protein